MNSVLKKDMFFIKLFLFLCSGALIVTGIFLYAYEIHVKKSLYKIDQSKSQSQSQSQSQSVFLACAENQLSLLTFNVWGLPVWLPRIDKVKRYASIPGSILNTNADIVCIQEAFDPKIRLRLLKTMDTAGYFFLEDYKCYRRMFVLFEKDCLGGLMTFSRYPIIWEKFYPHKILNDMKIDEKNGKKGFLISKINYTFGDIIVVNLHLYSGRSKKDEKFRMSQIYYLERIIDSLSFQNLPIIIQGDLNLVHPSVITHNFNSEKFESSYVYHYLTTKLKFVDTKSDFTENGITYDGKNNAYASVFYNSAEKQQKFDYCFYRFPTHIIDSVKSQIVFKKPAPLSDHYGLLSVFYFNDTLKMNKNE